MSTQQKGKWCPYDSAIYCPKTTCDNCEFYKPITPPCPFITQKIRNYPDCYEDCPDTDSCPNISKLHHEPNYIFDKCKCGDYRYQHENLTGKCKLPNDLCHGMQPCNSFRLLHKHQIQQHEPTIHNISLILKTCSNCLKPTLHLILIQKNEQLYLCTKCATSHHDYRNTTP